MKLIKILPVFVCLFPHISAAAPDLSGCEVIGYRVSSKTVEKCATPPEICKEEPNSNKCIMNTKTVEQCATEIASENAQMAEKYFVFKCPFSSEFSAYLASPQVTRLANYIYSDGTPIKSDVLLSDTEHVYVFRMGAGLAGGFGGYTHETSDYLLVAPDSEGLNLVEFK